MVFVTFVSCQRRSGEGDWTTEDFEVEAATADEAKSKAAAEYSGDSDVEYFDVLSDAWPLDWWEGRKTLAECLS